MGIGTAVLPYDITIYINSVDVTDNVPLDTIAFDDYASEPSNFNFTVQNPSGVVPDFGQSVVVYWNSAPRALQTKIFDGYVINVRNAKYDNGILLQYDLECQDKKILLQKSIIEFTECSGTEADIITCLLGSVYPDLSDLFDFTSGVDAFATDLNMFANDENMLDKLKELADLGGLDFSIQMGGISNTVTFDIGGLGSPLVEPINPTTIFDQGDLLINEDVPGGEFYEIDIDANGNPGNCMHIQGVQGAGDPALNMQIRVYISGVLGQDIHVTDIAFDYKGTTTGPSTPFVTVELFDSGDVEVYEDTADLTYDDTWRSFSASLAGLALWPYTGAVANVRVRLHGGGIGTHEIRMDNLSIEVEEVFSPAFGDAPQVNIGEAPLSEFDIDIDLSDEYAHDIDLDIGEFAFNSVTITGGNESVAVDWIYESDGTQDHFDLETEVSDIAVYQNDGTDGTPSWTLLTGGVWGVNDRTVDGGDKDVLYDTEKHWLYFNANPPALTKSFRVTGTILKPIRVRLEDVDAGDPTLAETVYDDTLTSEEAAIAKASGLLDRQSGVRRMTFKTFNPGLRPGTKINVTDTNRGLNESLVIRHIATQWLGASGSAEFTVEAGPANYASLDYMFADTEKRLKPKPPKAAIPIVTYGLLIDADNDFVIDADDFGILVRNG